MKKLSLIIFVMVLSASITAQEKTPVGILPFTYVSGAVDYQHVNSIQETVINAFVKTRRFNIVDRSKTDALKKEKELQKTDDFIDGSVVEQGRNLGAAYLVSGHIISAKAEAVRSDDGRGHVTITYKAKLSISLKVIDVASGQVIASETIEPKSGSFLGGLFGIGATSETESITKAIQKIEGKIDEFVANNFPVMFAIVEIQEKDGQGGATKVLLAGGSGFGLKSGDKLKVVELTEVEVYGKKLFRKKEIGELTVSAVEDENFSICSVTEGGFNIASRFEAKARLQVISKNKE